ncbi:LacI family DNA-binding transcriptional regulator [Opitutus sp. ER46]|uniref:LacI family DNA-binding transcriptional regulator n=1 Tax=Opitutus sp. ER46 TaxID=2161864 RepID=UPI000D3126BC|nr:LacI family DNA-binding transcriptional regulator [Opitutus sp. ER46]PTX96697.1 LacI family transcriptional regulator [Opitutus sp. ER46]
MSSGGQTIHDVARLANVSPSTVSNVLNGRRDRMRAETLERVMQAMADLGYAPNQVARGLKTGFIPTIGLIVPSVANPFWGAFARYVEHAALARNCQVLLCNGERDPAREQQYAESLLARGIRGLILGSAPLSLNHMVGLVKRGLHVVTFDREPVGADGVEFDSVRVDNAGGTRLAIEHLLALGHRRIAFVSGPIRSSNRRDRFEAYRAALAAQGVAVDDQLVWTEAVAAGDEEGTETGKSAARTLLQQPNPPTAFFAINDMTAFGVYAGVREAGREIPRDVSVVGFDDLRLCEVVTPPLTTVRQPLEDLMRSAVELLLARLEGKQTGPATHVTLPAMLVPRGSTQPAR